MLERNACSQNSAELNMNLKRAFHRNLGGLIFWLVSAQSWAGPVGLVQLSGPVAFSCGTGTGGFEGYCPFDDNIERGWFTLTYDPLIPDTDQDDGRGLFRNAIRSFDMTVSQLYRPDLAFSLVGRGDLSRESHWSDSFYWEMTLREKNNTFAPSLFSFHMYRQAWGNPNEMPTVELWPEVIGYVGGGAGVNETDWLPGSISADFIPRPVPVPGSLWLLLIGAAGVIFNRKRF